MSQPGNPDPTAPIIIVGPGRSGTSLLVDMLRRHPDVTSLGETRFAPQKIWLAIADLPAAHIAPLVKETRADWAAMSRLEFRRDVLGFKGVRKSDATRDIYLGLMDEEFTRRAAATARFMLALGPPSEPPKPRWCFKEIWAGSDAFPYGWDFYHRAFPNALFIQSARHPVEYAKSYIARQEPSEQSDDNTIRQLAQWVQMTRYNMSLASTGRHFLYRLEDLSAAPQRKFEEICAYLRLDVHAPCLESLNEVFGGTDRPRIDIPDSLLEKVPGLRALMDELDYA